MELEVEGKPATQGPNKLHITRSIKSLRSYGPSSFASLTASDGSYVQVAGGGVSCMIERYDAGKGRRFRAFHDKPSPVRPDGTILSFCAGNISMRSDEWFMASQVIEVFVAFMNGENFPEYLHWRDAYGF